MTMRETLIALSIVILGIVGTIVGTILITGGGR